MTQPLHPNHGIHDQRAFTPTRRPGSVRRTTTADCYWEGPLDGPCSVSVVGRDLLTTRTEGTRVLETARLEATLTPPSAMVTAISSPGSADALASLLGSSVSTGFRRVLAASVPELPRDQLLYRMLHDLPGTSLVGGMVIVRGGASPFSAADLLVMENVCRGWRTGGSQLEEVDAGRIPMPTGPFPTSLDDPADPLAWHDTEAPGRDIVRRGRRMDIWRSGDELRVDLHYRDTFHSSDQPTMVVHEYSLRASAAASDGEVRTITTEAHALPWVDCNTVPSSSESVIGARLGAIHVAVREQLRGAAGCTHLNDTLRELDTVPALALALGVGS